MAQWQSRVENAAILDKSTGYRLLEDHKEGFAVHNFRIPEHNNPDMRGLDPTSEEEEEEEEKLEPEIEYAEHTDELALGTGRNSLIGRLKDTDYPKEPGTFDQHMTKKPKRFGSDSGKQKRKHLVILKGKDSARGSEGEITEESLEKDLKESILKHMVEYNAWFAKIPVSDNHGDEVVVLEILPDPDMLEEEEVEFDILSDYDTSAVGSETEDAESFYSLEEEMVDPEDSIKDEYYIDDDSDDVEYNDRFRTIAPYIEDAPFVVADSGQTLGGDVGERGACLSS